MQKQLQSIIYKVKMNFYRKIFTKVREREGSLSAMEVFSLEVINSLDRPTISQFARFCDISQPNATYKVNSLIKKGYLKRVPSETDRREFMLELTDKYFGYAGDFDKAIAALGKRLEQGLSPAAQKEVEELLACIDREVTDESQTGSGEQ